MNTASASADTRPRTVPGDLAMWCFILAELTVFALLLGALAHARGRWPELFSAGMATVHPLGGLVNTLALLAGSYAVARGVGALARGRLAAWFAAALGCGALYVVVKVIEYVQLFGAGYTLRTDTFYFFYFFTTVFHLMHVLLGMVMLAVVARRAQRGRLGANEADQRLAEAVAGYWHMVDLVWLVLFPLLYVLR